MVHVNFFHDESSICMWLIVRFLSVEFNNNMQFCYEGKCNKYCTSISNIVCNFANFQMMFSIDKEATGVLSCCKTQNGWMTEEV